MLKAGRVLILATLTLTLCGVSPARAQDKPKPDDHAPSVSPLKVQIVVHGIRRRQESQKSCRTRWSSLQALTATRRSPSCVLEVGYPSTPVRTAGSSISISEQISIAAPSVLTMVGTASDSRWSVRGFRQTFNLVGDASVTGEVRRSADFNQPVIGGYRTDAYLDCARRPDRGDDRGDGSSKRKQLKIELTLNAPK